MDDLIEALTIMRKHVPADRGWPTNCVHEELWVYGPSPVDMPKSAVVRLEELSFTWDDECEGWFSLRFGSC